MLKYWLLVIIISLANFCFATTWYIGPTQTYTMPSQVSNVVADGDTVEIMAGVYESDVAKWEANNLVLRGVGGLAHLKANGNAYGGKAIWVIAGDNVKVEYMEFSECSVPDQNGAGIRQEGHNLTVNHCYFHDNENGILAGTINPSSILIEYSEFGYNGYGDGFSHNLYINNIDTLVFRFNYSHHCAVGHEFKSRANVNYILYNRLSDEAIGTASRCLDLPNGGTTYMIGNLIEQGPLSENHNIIGYGLEGLTNPAPHEFYVVNNTIVNDYAGGSFFQLNADAALFKAYNNILAGSGSFLTGSLPANIDTASNFVTSDIASLNFVDVSNYDYHLTSGSTPVFNMGIDPGFANGFSLTPDKSYSHPANVEFRCFEFDLEIGAYEFCVTDATKEKFADHFTIYPNPVHDNLTLTSLDKKLDKIQIYNIFGQRIIEVRNVENIDVSTLSPGFYSLKICSGSNHYSTSFIKSPQ